MLSFHFWLLTWSAVWKLFRSKIIALLLSFIKYHSNWSIYERTQTFESNNDVLTDRQYRTVWPKPLHGCPLFQWSESWSEITILSTALKCQNSQYYLTFTGQKNSTYHISLTTGFGCRTMEILHGFERDFTIKIKQF